MRWLGRLGATSWRVSVLVKAKVLGSAAAVGEVASHAIKPFDVRDTSFCERRYIRLAKCKVLYYYLKKWILNSA